jgi:hypothetical protein
MLEETSQGYSFFRQCVLEIKTRLQAVPDVFSITGNPEF